MGNNLVMTMPKSAIWVTGFREGEILEIDVKGDNMIIARKLLYEGKPASEKPIVS
jgi:antitoxin component of MazEF toxin-antitoxin module